VLEIRKTSPIAANILVGNTVPTLGNALVDALYALFRRIETDIYQAYEKAAN